MAAKKPENESIQVKDKSRSRFTIFLAVWVVLIFGTSCTVIEPQEFFKLVQRGTGARHASLQRFEVFWGVSWFAIVKGWHFAEFAILTLLCAGAIRWWRGALSSWSIVSAMALCMVFAITDEWHQSFVPNRHGTIQDVIIDSAGVCTAGIFLLVFRSRKRA